MLWHIGNTTVRTPYRLREALIALQGSPLHGNLIGTDQETAFARLLHFSNIVDVKRIAEDAGGDFSDLGRKWRSALSQLGFITHKFSKRLETGEIDPLLGPATSGIAELSGRPFEITPNGYRLINAEIVAGQQETFLRSLLAYQIPSPVETGYDCAPFSPLRFVINILFEIQSLGGAVFLSFDEYGLFVQTSSPEGNITDIASNILDFRARRIASTGSIRAFDRDEYKRIVLLHNPGTHPDKVATKINTLNDYADLSLRYLKATGLFRSRGRGITLNPIREELAQLINGTPEANYTSNEYLINLWQGAVLPTDNLPAATRVVQDLAARIQSRGRSLPQMPTGIDISQQRLILEQLLSQIEEEDYYRAQAGQTDEIIAWIETLLGGSATLPNGDRVSIPRGEAPAYLEWVIWRLFLAINSLVNAPWQARRFQIDQDFLPVGTAPGNGPDMVFEFADAKIVVEVTLTRSSRQEAAEGEPVRRHVAKYVEEEGENGKPVYGLFIAVDIDSNTANTFRMGDWYLPDDSKLNLQIVPMKLEDLLRLFQYGRSNLSLMPKLIQDVLLRARSQANNDAPAWKRFITNLVNQTVQTR